MIEGVLGLYSTLCIVDRYNLITEKKDESGG